VLIRESANIGGKSQKKNQILNQILNAKKPKPQKGLAFTKVRLFPAATCAFCSFMFMSQEAPSFLEG